MLEPWLGSLDPVVLHRLVRVNGPDGLKSFDYARDFNEVKRYGRLVSSRRSSDETKTAYFFNSNSATTVGRALIGYLTANPMSLRATARVFGVMHGAMTDAVIKCWRLKRDIGFWRPSQAILRADEDRNAATTPRGRLDLPAPAGTAVRRLRQRARLPHLPRDRDDPADAR